LWSGFAESIHIAAAMRRSSRELDLQVSARSAENSRNFAL
jgi:hypothetical protein